MQKYKVEITKVYCIDVLAKYQQEAEEKAGNILFEELQNSRGHYLQTGDDVITTFDVTNTDDPFNP
jgi:hypothetical protein